MRVFSRDGRGLAGFGGAAGLVLTALAALSCSPTTYFNLTSSLGRSAPENDTPGQRGDISVSFINHMPYRAVFTFGTYDPLNTPQGLPTSFAPKFQQFFVDTVAANRLDAFSDTGTITFTRDNTSATDPGGCGRAMSVGGEGLIELIENNRSTIQTSSNGQVIHDEVLRPVCDPTTGQPAAGVGFFLETSPGPQENACDSAAEMVAWAAPVLTLQGAEYQCGSLLVYSFEQDPNQPGGVRIDLKVILP